jgi:two-component system response regulator VicR
MKILLVDDERSMRSLVKRIVEDDGHEFCFAVDGKDAMQVFRDTCPDMVLLDVMLPSKSGFDICTELREEGVDVPIIFLSAKGDIVDKGIGFKAGGDDYLVKPFSPQELSMRINAHLRVIDRRNKCQPGNYVRVGDLFMDTKKWVVKIGGKDIELTRKEFQILLVLAGCPGEVFTHEQLIEAVWGKGYVDGTTSIAVFVRKIREKIEDNPSDPKRVLTVWHVGYKYCIPEGE